MCFPPLLGGEPLEDPLGLCPCFPVIPVVLYMEEVASPTIVPEVPWLALRLQSSWEIVPALPGFLPSVCVTLQLHILLCNCI